MAEGDDEKEADASKSPTKRPLDRVPLKLIIKRTRPTAEAKPVPPPVKKKAKKNPVVPVVFLSKYGELGCLVNALEEEKPHCLQEVWHCGQQHHLEDDYDIQSHDSNLHHKYYDSAMCEFGSECEMPWLHPDIDASSWQSETQQGCQSEQKQEEVNVTKQGPEEKHCDAHDCDQNDKNEIHFADWRHGPAKLWYDQMNIPDEDCKDFTYGFKLKEEKSDRNNGAKIFSDDAFLMVTQLHWEDDVIWNAEDLKPEAKSKFHSKFKSVGGRLKGPDRLFPISRYNYQHRLPGYLQMSANERNFFSHRPMVFKTPYSMQPLTTKDRDDDSWKSDLPFDNEDLMYSTWEDEVIWDHQNMPQIPKPKIPLLDPNDENVILGVPEDSDLHDWATPNPDCVKLRHPHIKDSKIMIGKKGMTTIIEKDQQPVFLEDPFNVSNDSYYAQKSSDTALRLKPVAKLIQHSTPATELRPPFIPTHLSVLRLQNFHRPPLKKYSHGQLAHSIAHPVHSLSREISLKAKLREEERQASGGGDVFFMHTPEDLSGRDGELVLFEFSEEHPLLMNEVGMCSKIINYYKRKASKDQGPPSLRYGEVVYPHTSPFLGVLSQGDCIQAVENNLYRTPIFEHRIRETDFLVIRTRHSLSIREVDALFVAGQQCPLYEVPAPHTKCANNFTRDFLQVHIFRMFQSCPDWPPWVKMDEIKRAFPDINDLNIRKCLKLCAEFKRVDTVDSNCWVLRPDFRLPTEEELRASVSPEQCCAQFSMMAAMQRLKDAGYGNNCLFVPPDEDEGDEEEDNQLKIDDEVKAAPWNLTRGYIQALSGKCLLDLTGPVDPTGCGEGFSYLTRSKRPGKQVIARDAPVESEKPSVANARILLRRMGVPEKEIKSLSSWELLDIARSVSKKKLKGRGRMNKVPKARPMTTAEHLIKYKEECQRLFDLQNKVLQSTEELSSDEEELSDNEGSDVEEMGKILEKLISNGKSYSEICTENEEREREQLVKMMMDDNAQKQSTSKDKKKKDGQNGPQQDRVLKINRTFRDSNGKEYTRVEFVRKSSVIDFYLKIRATKDEALISKYSALESAEKQRIMREKRSIETQLQRIKQREHLLGSKQDSGSSGPSTGSSSHLQEKTTGQMEVDRKPQQQATRSGVFLVPMSKKINSKVDLKRRCGACGNPGHKKGNKSCPQYCGPVNVAMTEEEEEEYQRQMNVDDQNLVNVDGTKLKLSVKLIKRAEEMKRKTLVLRVPKDIVRKRKRPLMETRCDYLEKYQRPVNRRRVDPVVVLSNIFESILNEMRDLPTSDPFHFPVNPKVLPYYYTIIKQPMDLQTIRENVRQRKYKSRKGFLEHVHQIVQNSSTFNGVDSPFTINATKMLDLCVERMGEQEEELIRLEETINPSGDEKDQCDMPQKTVRPSANGIRNTQTVPKAILDLSISDTEDEAEIEAGYIDGRACPVVP